MTPRRTLYENNLWKLFSSEKKRVKREKNIHRITDSVLYHFHSLLSKKENHESTSTSTANYRAYIEILATSLNA